MREKFTADTARHFQGFSLMNAAIVASALQGHCLNGCQPYQDVFTFNRWKAQGLIVKKGEHGIKVTTWIVAERRRDGPRDNGDCEPGAVERSDSYKVPRTTTVFCRCQVQAA